MSNSPHKFDKSRTMEFLSAGDARDPANEKTLEKQIIALCVLKCELVAVLGPAYFTGKLPHSQRTLPQMLANFLTLCAPDLCNPANAAQIRAIEKAFLADMADIRNGKSDTWT